jgi:hypothetical protein
VILSVIHHRQNPLKSWLSLSQWITQLETCRSLHYRNNHVHNIVTDWLLSHLISLFQIQRLHNFGRNRRWCYVTRLIVGSSSRFTFLPWLRFESCIYKKEVQSVIPTPSCLFQIQLAVQISHICPIGLDNYTDMHGNTSQLLQPRVLFTWRHSEKDHPDGRHVHIDWYRPHRMDANVLSI